MPEQAETPRPLKHLHGIVKGAMSDPDLDKMLRGYLEREERDPVREILRKQADWQMGHEQKDEVRHGELLRRLDGHHFRIGSLEQQASKLEKEVEDTGQHNIAALKSQLRRWDDLRWRIFQLVVLFLLGGGVVEFIHQTVRK